MDPQPVEPRSLLRLRKLIDRYAQSRVLPQVFGLGYPFQQVARMRSSSP